VRAQQAVENERSWLEAIMQHAPEGILVVDYEGNLQFSNTAVERIMGRPLIGNLSALEPGLRIFYSDGSPYPLENIPLVRHAIAGHSSINNHLHVERLDGACVPLLLSVAPVRSQTGEVTSAVVIFQDITHIVQAEQALRESEARFRGLVQSLNDIVYTLDETGCITGVYGRGLDRLGLSKQAVLGKHLREIFPTPANIHEAAMERALGGEGQVYEWVTSTRLGALHFQNAVSPLQDEQGSVNGVVCLSRDVTLYRQAEQSLKNYADRLRRSNMELEQFAFIASHDLQEPLRKIHAFGQRLLQRFRDRADTEDLDYMERMINAADRMQKMIIDLLAFSRVTTKGQPFEQVNLNAVISDVISDLEVRIERTGGKVLVSALPDLQADPLQMHQLFQNLIGNGLKYHRADLPPELHIRGALVPRGKAAGGGSQAHDDRAAQELVQITISDNGIGFDEQYLERIFQPFERLHGRSEYEGTGMGLAICNKIIERHHGTITAHSQPGQGATFVIILPRKQENRDLDDGLEV
jgi:PAS domain S-box-containing protein